MACCAGHSGIAGGQELDLRYEKKNISRNKVIEMQRKKTGVLHNSQLVITKQNGKILMTSGIGWQEEKQ